MKTANPPLTLPMSNEWTQFFEQLIGRRERFALRRYFGFCSSLGLKPHEISDQTLDLFTHALENAGIRRHKEAARVAAKMWNKLSERCANWPQVLLTVPVNAPPKSLSSANLPESFTTSVEAFLNFVPQGYFGNPRRKILSEKTRIDKRRKIFQLATHAHHCGVSLTQLTHVHCLIEAETTKNILERLWRLAGKKPKNHYYNLARQLRYIAEQAPRAPRETLALISRAEAEFWEKKKGVTAKSRRQLHPFIDENILLRLIRLPTQILRRLDPQNPKFSDAVPLQSALAISLLFDAPIQIQYLVPLDAEKNFKCLNQREIHLNLTQETTSDHRPSIFALSASTQKIFNIYVNIYQPLMAKSATHKIFISRTGKEKTPAALSAQIKEFISTNLGHKLTPANFRHLAAFIYYQNNPNDYETIKQFLGHASVLITMELYAYFDDILAARRYDKFLDGALETLEND